MFLPVNGGRFGVAAARGARRRGAAHALRERVPALGPAPRQRGAGRARRGRALRVAHHRRDPPPRPLRPTRAQSEGTARRADRQRRRSCCRSVSKIVAVWILGENFLLQTVTFGNHCLTRAYET